MFFSRKGAGKERDGSRREKGNCCREMAGLVETLVWRDGMGLKSRVGGVQFNVVTRMVYNALPPGDSHTSLKSAIFPWCQGF